MTPPTVTPIRCEILAPSAAHSSVLAEVTAACARDLGQPLDVTILRSRRSSHERTTSPTLTLCLPAELAAAQHQVWFLACRLACFCPSARVSVLVLGAFADDAAVTPHRQSA